LLTAPQNSAQVDYRSLPYLIRQMAIRYLGAASLLEIPYVEVSQDSYAGFAPGQAGVFGRALAFGEREIQQAKAIWGGETYLSSTASESRLKQEGIKARILHIVAHGTIHDSLPLRSALSLAPDEADDGRLEIGELYNLRFDNQLAILSACESGQGNWKAGEGLISLANGFHYGGCPNVVVSRWAVQDAASQQIISSLLHLLRQGMRPEEALREAQLSYLDKTAMPHPYFWSAWMVNGPTQAIQTNRSIWLTYSVLALLLLLGGYAFWQELRDGA
ncbi:MAG: CHAT domain-containing protein, partial [Bacteroidota bacterium]